MHNAFVAALLPLTALAAKNGDGGPYPPTTNATYPKTPNFYSGHYPPTIPVDIPTSEPNGTLHKPNVTFTPGVNGGEFLDWKTFKSNGVNLGSWLEKEKTHDPIWWDQYAPDTIDEWSFCQALGDRCGPVLEERYASFLNESTIDLLASVGVNCLRIPTTYAAWVKVPGSQLYTGNQVQFLSKISKYAIEKYNMHIIVGLHSLPGGANSLDIGEAFGHDAWFYNATNLEYTYDAVDAMLDFIKNSGHFNAFTLAPLNEVSDTNLVGFGTPAGLTQNGSDYVVEFMKGVLDRVAAVDTGSNTSKRDTSAARSKIPVMFQDNFKGADFWSPYFNATDNIVIDSHVYYFAAAGTYSNYILPAVCGQAAYLANLTTNFPTFIGEWSLQTLYNNTLAGRKTIFDTERYAWIKYVAGGAFWTAVSYATTPVDGEGTQQDYWSYAELIQEGVAVSQINSSYCS